MIKWMKLHKDMTNTLISALLIFIGIILQFKGINNLAVPTFILAFVIGGYYSAKEGLTELIKDKHLNVDVLMILAAIGASLIGYWMEGALLIFIFSLAESMETMANEKSKNAISELLNLTPDTARRYTHDNTIEIVKTEDLKIGDIIQVPRGDTVPIDGTLNSKYSIINESAITGESIPVEKTKGMEVIGGTINEGNVFDIIVSVEDKDTLFSKIIRLVEEAQSSPSKTANFIESIEGPYVKIVLVGVPLFILFVYFILGWTFTESFYRGMVLLTVASPCALVASATPATLSAISRAAKRGMVFKGGQAIDNVQALDAIIFDKTGTLTVGKPEVTSDYFLENTDVKAVKEVVKAAEYSSTHPIASALVEYLSDTQLIELEEIEDITGKGFKVDKDKDNDSWKIGKHEFVITEDNISMTEAMGREAIKKENEGCTVIYVSKNRKLKGYFALEDQLKPESKEAIETLNAMGIETIMVTGDNKNTARYIAKRIGIKEVYANKMPDEKSSILKEIKEKFGNVGMVGDGINDAPALAKADIGFAMGSGTDIAMETADVVLVQDDLKQIGFAVNLSKKMKRIVKANVIFSLSVIILLITANIFQTINLPIGVIGHEGSTILVILNGLRLLVYKD